MMPPGSLKYFTWSSSKCRFLFISVVVEMGNFQAFEGILGSPINVSQEKVLSIDESSMKGGKVVVSSIVDTNALCFKLFREFVIEFLDLVAVYTCRTSPFPNFPWSWLSPPQS